MASIEVVLAMLLAVIASGYLVRALPISLPLPLVQIALGSLVAGVSSHGVVLDPQIFFLLFLPPLLFLDGWRIPNDGLRRDRRTILGLALGLVVFTVIGAGFLIHWMIPTMPRAVAFALAAIVSPTDPVAVSSIASRVRIPTRLMHVLEGEALLNDASGLVCLRFAVAAAMTGKFSIASASVTFLWVALVGIAIGVGTTYAITFVQRRSWRLSGTAGASPILINLLTPFGAYLLAEHLRASGILAAVGAGITMSYVELTGRALATTRLQRTAVWDTLQFTLNGVMFVLLGEQLPDILRGAVSSVEQSGRGNPWWLAIYALVISVGLALLRFVWVSASLRLTMFKARHRGEQIEEPHWRLVLAASLAGVRGAITLAGVLTLPLLMPDGSPFPARGLAVFLAAAVILLSLVMATVGLPAALKSLDLPDEPGEQLAEDQARRAATQAAIKAIEIAKPQLATEDADLYTETAAHVMTIYQHRLAHAGGEEARKQRMDRAERVLRLAALAAERDTFFKLARDNRISDAISRKLVREIDLLESRYR